MEYKIIIASDFIEKQDDKTIKTIVMLLSSFIENYFACYENGTLADSYNLVDENQRLLEISYEIEREGNRIAIAGDDSMRTVFDALILPSISPLVSSIEYQVSPLAYTSRCLGSTQSCPGGICE